MDEIGLFPLGVVLLPTERVPLHIFEPRYRELIAECLEEAKEFGFLFGDEGEGQRVGTRATVTEVLSRHADGRLDVVVEGGDRFRVVEDTEGRSFRTALIEQYDDLPDAAAPTVVARALVLFGRLVELTGSDSDVPDAGSALLSFEFASRFDFAPPLKQELLEERSERIRLDRMCEILEEAAVVVARQHEIAELASTNGHAKPGDP
ncbi:MAG: LON peptidase substrate-binding domain-containing protein [Gaiellaceae bacterium]